MKRVVVAVAAVVSGIVGVGASVRAGNQSAEVADPSFGMSASEMQTLNAEYSAAPLLLPEVLPQGYGWAGVGEVQGDGQIVWARTSQFTSVNGDPMVEVCAKGLRQAHGCEGDGDLAVERVVNDFRVVISFEEGSAGGVEDRLIRFWKTVDLTTEYRDVRWLGN